MSGGLAGGEAGGGDEGNPRLLAGEYVLGVLSADEMRAVRREARTDAELAAEIRSWETQLLPLARAVTPVAPPPALWDRLEQAIAPAPPEAANDDLRQPATGRPATGQSATGRPATGRPATGRPARRGVLGWQVATGVSLALAAGIAAFAFLQPAPVVTQPAQFAAIAPLGTAAPAFVAATQPDGTVVLTSVSPAPVPPGKDLELWVLPPGATKVAPLGVLSANGGSVRLPAPASGTQLLISLEPAGGSTTGQPTGPVLYGGTLIHT